MNISVKVGRDEVVTNLAGPATAQVTGATSRPNTSTLSGRSNPNKPIAAGGAQDASKNSPSIGTTYTKPNFHGKPVK